jgi:Peptidoglycan-binding protein, CsiV
MPMKNLFFAVLITISVGASPGVWAKSRWYQVEVIVFRYTDSETAGGEYWSELESLPEFRDAVELLVDLPEFSDEPPSEIPNEVSIPGPLAFQSLGLSELKLSGVFRRLKQVSAYEPILHVGWRQPGFGGRRARSVYISDKAGANVDTPADTTSVMSDPAPGPRRIEGTVRIRTGRLLHVDVDFVSFGGDSPVRITEQRKVKLKELHYFDHPLFGVLVRVTPYRPPEPVEQTAAAPDLGDDRSASQ